MSVTVPGTSGNNDSENWEPIGDRSVGDPCPEAVFSTYHSSNLGVSEQEETPDIVTRVQEEIPCCSPGTSSVKQKKARSTSQPQFRSENTPATIEADQILLACQQLATNRNSAYFNNNINRISKLSKSLTGTMPTFDGKSEKFKLFEDFEDLFQLSLKLHDQLTEEDKMNYFHSLIHFLFKKNYQHQRGEFGRNSDCVPLKKCETSVNSYSKSQISTAGFQSSESEVILFSR